MTQTELLSITIEAALEAGKKIMEIYKSDDFGVNFKSDDSPLTKADIASHKIIESYLLKTDIPILSEEGIDIPYNDRKDWKQLWIVDPIDGTKEFINKNG
jgi:3'(2'), 5'-bisphosphate nucleotidase